MKHEDPVTPRRRLNLIGGLLGLALLLAGGGALAAELSLPRDTASALAAEIDRQCPDCREKGLSPCGTGDVQIGKRLVKTLFQGEPGRAYFLTFVMPHRAFFDALATPDRDGFIAAMTERFKEARLIALDDGFKGVRVLPPPSDVVVDYSPEHHQCFGIDRKSSSCCLGDGGTDKTCPPKADSPRVHMRFVDDAVGERLDVVYAPLPGFSKLVRHGSGKARLYYCLTDDRGTLEAD